MGARLPLLQSGDHRFSLRGRRQVTCQIWRRWLEAGIQSIRLGQSRQQMPEAEKGIECIQEERETETKNITNHW